MAETKFIQASCKSQVASCKLQVASCKLQVENYKLQVENYKLQVAIFKLPLRLLLLLVYIAFSCSIYSLYISNAAYSKLYYMEQGTMSSARDFCIGDPCEALMRSNLTQLFGFYD